MTAKGNRWNEETLSKDPAVELLEALGYQYLSPVAIAIALAPEVKEAIAKLIGDINTAIATNSKAYE